MSEDARIDDAPGKEVWIGKAEAAKLLGVSIRQLEVRSARGDIRKQRLAKLPSERNARVVYAVEDIQKCLDGTIEPQPGAPAVARRDSPPWESILDHLATLARAISTPALPAPPASEHLEELAERQMLQVAKLTERQTEITERQAEQFGALVGVISSTLPAIARALPAAETRAWLTLSEAAAYTGLPARWLRESAKQGRMRAENVGEKRERWMFARDGLR